MQLVGSKRFFAAKNAIFRSPKSANFAKNFATNPELASLQCTILVHLLNIVKFRQKLIFSSRGPAFVISSVFHQKQNHLEPSN